MQYDVCTIGAGAAGITLARALNGSGLSIGLLESGGLDFDEETQDLYRGVSRSPFLDASGYLDRSRLRFFGGTTNHWNGMCRPLDALDFAARPWVPHSGWPMGREDLEPFYRRAADILQFAPYEDSWGDVISTGDTIIPPGEAFLGRTFRISPPTRFGAVYRDELTSARTVDVLLRANAVHLDTDEAGTAVTQVRVASLDGRRVTVGARVFVLAAGGIENARLLLASNSVQASGLGNGADCVGRYFMEHPELVVAHLLVTDAGVLGTLQALQRDWAALCLSADAQRSGEVLNVGIQLLGGRVEPSEAGGTPLDIREAMAHLDRGESATADPAPPAYMAALARLEAAPRPDSRVTLEDRETDALGMRRARLAFAPGALESRTIVFTLRALARELGRRQAGRLMLAHPDDAGESPLGEPPWRNIEAGNHHMGTTRMSRTPVEGVVDPDCRVHGMRNLYVAGSSVFPTAGMANPTFTLVALALRLADHLTRQEAA